MCGRGRVDIIGITRSCSFVRSFVCCLLPRLFACLLACLRIHQSIQHSSPALCLLYTRPSYSSRFISALLYLLFTALFYPTPLCSTLSRSAPLYTNSILLTILLRCALLYSSLFCSTHRLAGLVVKAPASGAEDPGFKSRLRRDFSGSSHTSDLNIGTPVATLPGAWQYRVSAGTGRPGVSIL